MASITDRDTVLSRRRLARALAVAAVVAFAIGSLTAFGQQWLPHDVNSLANSAGSWSLACFVLVLVTTTRVPWAALLGGLALIGMLAGYVVTSDLRGYPSSTALMLFWSLAAVTAGPALGVSAAWIRTGGPRRVAAVAVPAGVLTGECVYGLINIADTTSPVYWTIEGLAGLALLAWVVTRRIRSSLDAGMAVASTIVIAGLFYVVSTANLIVLF